jgi:starch synthase
MALQRELGLAADEQAPLLAVVSRLTDQKGMDLLLRPGPKPGRRAPSSPCWARAMPRSNRRSAMQPQPIPAAWPLRIGYDEALSHRIMAGADAIVIPSRFEPCGLTQLYGLRYGALPIVRRVGGLADTVVDPAQAGGANRRGAGRAEPTGFVFEQASAAALADALGRAIAAWRDRPRWRAMMGSAMRADFSWDTAATVIPDAVRIG